ncbi:MAG TPA: hypothetical protein VJM08_10010 [Anaerolineales bacterium]|nr:hypothetical protein [Anaerolineales bacterium]
MYKTKLLTSIVLALAVLFAQVGMVAASPTAQETTPITGTIESITTETDSNGVTTVLVTLVDDQGTTQTVRLSLETAVALDLVVVDPVTNEPVIDETQVGQTIEIDPTTVIPDEPVEETLHPIAVLLAAFFGEEGSVVNGYHEDGFGFGVIAQALWMSKNINDDASLAGLILEAKKSGDYSAFTLPDGSTPTNWGQFKKAVLEKKNNLGVVVSGQADQSDSDDTTTTNSVVEDEHGNGKNKDKGNGKDKDKKNKNKP